jgi:hypothetical protein
MKTQTITTPKTAAIIGGILYLIYSLTYFLMQ